jgi:hypothetical protein
MADSVEIGDPSSQAGVYKELLGQARAGQRAEAGPTWGARLREKPRAEPTYEPGVTDTGWWATREAARTPIRFRDRVRAQFSSPQNLEYLHDLFNRRVPRGPLREFTLATLHDAVLSFIEYEGRAFDVLTEDPIAQRGSNRPAVSLWSEIKRLNRVFYEDRLALLRDQAHIIENRAPRDGIAEDEEPYHMRMFISDSLRPPGLEHFNTPGPLWALREDQSTWEPRPRTGGALGGGAGARDGGVGGTSGPFGPPRGRVPRETFAGSAPARRGAPPRGARPDEAFAAHRRADPDVFMYGEDDSPWDIGDPNRTPEQAVAEYWGDSWTVSETTTGAPETMGKAYGATYGWGDTWAENGGTRFQRFESIPYWQKGGREGYEADIEENLGTAARELDGQVRRFDMDKIRNPRGQEYRRYGPRTGHVV